MKIGCIALIEPFAGMEQQLRTIRELGISYADLADNHDGASLGNELGFAASISLDCHPARIRKLLQMTGITLTSLCTHANLLDPTSPDTYSTLQIIKAVRLAHLLGVRSVVTCEGEPKTAFGRGLTPAQRLFTIREKLYMPIEWAEELGIELLIETHSEVTGNLHTMGDLLEALGHEKTLGVCLNTGNAWLAGSDPVDIVRALGARIRHIHWKDIPASWENRRGKVLACGLPSLALGDGVVGIEPIIHALQRIGFDGPTTIEVAGVENIRLSRARLRQWLAS